jgi:hypothetical protein
VTVDGRRLDLDVVHTNDLAAVHVDDLLIEQIALEQEDAVRRGIGAPLRRFRHRAHRAAARFDVVGGQRAFAARRLDD